MRKKSFKHNLSSINWQTRSLLMAHLFALLFIVIWMQNYTETPKGLPFHVPIITDTPTPKSPSNVNIKTPVLIYGEDRIVISSLSSIHKGNIKLSRYPIINTQKFDKQKILDIFKLVKKDSGSNVLIFITYNETPFNKVSSLLSILYGYTDDKGHYTDLFPKIIMGGELI